MPLGILPIERRAPRRMENAPHCFNLSDETELQVQPTVKKTKIPQEIYEKRSC
jgi:hypothetical protein